MTTPLTVLSEDEKMFVEEIEKFAKEQIGPKVLEMDESEAMDLDNKAMLRNGADGYRGS